MKRFISGYRSRGAAGLFVLCWVAYFSTYICRLNYSAVMPRMLASFNESRLAAVSSAFFICYGVGQLVAGVLGDRLSARYLIFGGISVSAICNILIFFFHTNITVILCLWALNGAAQSLVWSPILHLSGEYYDPGERQRFGIDISTTVPLGTLASYGISLLTLMLLPWHYVFLTCGLTVAAAAVVWLTGTGHVLPKLGKYTEVQPDSPANEGRADAGVMLKMLPMLLLLIIPIVVQGTLKDSVTQWIPTFFESRFMAGATLSLGLTMALPLVNVTGAYFARAINKRLKNEAATSAVFFAAAGAFLAVLLLTQSRNIVLSLICMAGVTNCMFAVNVMLLTIVPLRFSRFGRASTVGGTLNAVAYIGCAGMNLAAGRVLEAGEGAGTMWSSLFVLWIALAAAALVFSLACAVREIRRKK